MPQLFDTAKPLPRAVVLAVHLPESSDAEFASSLEEISRLGKTLGLTIIGRVTQKRSRLAPGAVVGEGKLKELARWTGGPGSVYVGPPLTKKQKAEREERARELRGEAGEAAAEGERENGAAGDDGSEEAADDTSKALPKPERAGVVLVDHDLSPSQARNLEKACDAEVIDRSGVILAIFQRHARSREARLQVEIARLTYLAPRLRETGLGEDRQGGGIGGKGAGESSAELDRRKIRDRIAELQLEIVAMDAERQTQRALQSKKGERKEKQVERAKQQVQDRLVELAPVFTKTKYMLGDDFTMLDVAIAPLLWRLDHFGIRLVARLNDFSVTVHIIGVIVIVSGVALVGLELREGGIELADHGLVEGVEHRRPVHRDLHDARPARRGGERGVGHQ